VTFDILGWEFFSRGQKELILCDSLYYSVHDANFQLPQYQPISQVQFQPDQKIESTQWRHASNANGRLLTLPPIPTLPKAEPPRATGSGHRHCLLNPHLKEDSPTVPPVKQTLAISRLKIPLHLERGPTMRLTMRSPMETWSKLSWQLIDNKKEQWDVPTMLHVKKSCTACTT
jgi:hypothetical protein